MADVDVSMKVYEAVIDKILYKGRYDVNRKLITAVRDGYPKKSAKEILNDAIGHGCGGTLYKEVDGYWLVDYFPGIKVRVVDHDLKMATLSRKVIIAMAEEMLQSEYMKSKQLNLEL